MSIFINFSCFLARPHIELLWGIALCTDMISIPKECCLHLLTWGPRSAVLIICSQQTWSGLSPLTVWDCLGFSGQRPFWNESQFVFNKDLGLTCVLNGSEVRVSADGQTDRRVDATKRIISPASRSIKRSIKTAPGVLCVIYSLEARGGFELWIT